MVVLGSCDKDKDVDPTPAKPVYRYDLDVKVSFSSQETDTVKNTKGFVLKLDKRVARSEIADTDVIVLYNQTKGVFACDSVGNCIYLEPIIRKGLVEYFTIKQDVTFYRYTDGGEWESVKVDPTDKYSVYYQINDVCTQEPAKSSLSLALQTGDFSDLGRLNQYIARDVTLSMEDNRLYNDDPIALEPKTAVVVLNFKYLSRDGDSVAAPVSVHKVTVLTTHETLVGKYYTVVDSLATSLLHTAGLDKDGRLYLTVMSDFRYIPSNVRDYLFVEMLGTDADGNLVGFRGRIDQPERGFEKGCIYVRDMDVRAVSSPGVEET